MKACGEYAWASTWKSVTKIFHIDGVGADGFVVWVMDLGFKRGYDLMWNNCESFARWCKVGKKVSHQSVGGIVAAAVAGSSLLFGTRPSAIPTTTCEALT